MGTDENRMTEERETGTGESERRELLVLKAGAQLLGVFADEADRVVTWRRPTPLPRAPQAVLGVVSVRGRMLTVLDPLALLGERKAGDETPDGGGILPLRGDEQLALAVDQPERTIEIDTSEIGPDGQNSKAMHGVIHDERGQQIIVLNTSELFAVAMQGVDRRRRRF